MRAHLCMGCGMEYGETEWAGLQVTERIAPSQVRCIVRDWPETMCIEVRRCRRCGRAIAAKQLAR
jgi:hypothetical protein